MAEDDVTTKVFENTEACACVDMLIEVDVCKTVANDVCLQRGESFVSTDNSSDSVVQPRFDL